VTALTLSLPLKRKVAASLLLGSGGPLRISVSGGTSSGGGVPPSQVTPKHCSGWMLSAARLPPPSILAWPVVPTAA
jgi:hypothetical protein